MKKSNYGYLQGFIRIPFLLLLILPFILFYSCGGKSTDQDGEEEGDGIEIVEEDTGAEITDQPVEEIVEQDGSDGEQVDGQEVEMEDVQPDGEGIPCECESNEECDDGIFCNGAETCDGCYCHSATVGPCDDSVYCTEDICTEETKECQNTPNHSLCDEDEFCDPSLGCVPRPACTTDEECIDSYICNGTEYCDTDLGICMPGTPLDCSDSFRCTEDICSESQGGCVHTPSDSLCTGDGLFCTVETCVPDDPSAGSDGCVIQDRVCPDDGFSCTLEACDENLDMCVHTPNHAVCLDTLRCNGEETCDPSNPNADLRGCIPGTPVDCSDSIDCTRDSCTEDSGCQHVPDNFLCRPGEVCDPASGCVPFTCRSDIDCDDGFYCNGQEICNSSHQCENGTPVDCTDSFSCTDDSCNEANRRCDNTPNNSRCDDGLRCTADICDPSSGITPSGCVYLTLVCPDDGYWCTSDECQNSGPQMCPYPIQAGTCLINRQCYRAGDVNPDAPCLVCDPARSQTEWSIASNTCYISSRCYNNNDRNPSNECEACISSSSQTSWTPLNSTPPGTVYPCASDWGMCFSGVCCMVRRPQCSDGLDNNGNDIADWPDDPGCTGPLDNTESDILPFLPQCNDRRDNDGDTLIDMRDPGCHSTVDNYEGEPHPACNDGVDNDGDGLADFPDDPGCDSLSDRDESGGDVCHQCSDSLDNERDGLSDFPNDTGCSSRNDNDEWNPGFGSFPECSDGRDNDGDTLVDFPDDPQCFSRTDTTESSTTIAPPAECRDGFDNDGDGLIDALDPDCTSTQDNFEGSLRPQCGDGFDNDWDGTIDYPNDRMCFNASDVSERL